VRWPARREQAAFAWMASYRPDLVIRLNVDLDTACARKPDHRREQLQRKIVVTPRLSYNGAPIVDVDAARSLDEVSAAAEAAAARVLSQHR
jgi:thymidylate kinase